jgi:hypothetical protein
MFLDTVARHRFRRFAVLRSMPLSSAPNSCAVISRRRSVPPSPNGTAYVPSSSRLLHTAKPSRSQYKILTRSFRRLVKTNRCPAKASNSRCSRTSACRLSKLLRMSHGVRHRYTRTLAGRWIMPATRPARRARSRCPRQRQCPAARRSPTPVPVPPPPCALAVARPFPPKRTALALFPGAVCARHRRSIRSARVVCRTVSRSCRCAVVSRFVRPTRLLSG